MYTFSTKHYKLKYSNRCYISSVYLHCTVPYFARDISALCLQKSKLAVERGIVNMYAFNLPYPAVRPGCVPWSSIIVCNEKLE